LVGESAAFNGDGFRRDGSVGLGIHCIRKPNIVDVVGMNKVTKENAARGNSGEQMGIVGGLVTQEVNVRFENMKRQWRCTPVGGANSKNGPAKFQFQGGDVMIEMSLGIYVLNIYEPKPQDQISKEIFALIYSHELLHVWDAVDVLKNTLLPNLPAEPTVKRYLFKAEPYVYGKQSQNLFDIEREFHAFVQKSVTTEAHNLMADESNRRQSRRDSPSEYKIVRDQIDDLRIKQINSP
jgi:hypothetical protein